MRNQMPEYKKMKLFGLFLGMAHANMFEMITDKMNKVSAMAEDEIEFPCLRQFYEGCFKCANDVQGGHPFCQEENPNFNAVGCAIVINKCLNEKLTGILDCPNEH